MPNAVSNAQRLLLHSGVQVLYCYAKESLIWKASKWTLKSGETEDILPVENKILLPLEETEDVHLLRTLAKN